MSRNEVTPEMLIAAQHIWNTRSNYANSDEFFDALYLAMKEKDMALRPEPWGFGAPGDTIQRPVVPDVAEPAGERVALARPSQGMLIAGVAVWEDAKHDHNMYPDVVDVVRRIYQVMEARRVMELRERG